jgi:hypothetical protein
LNRIPLNITFQYSRITIENSFLLTKTKLYQKDFMAKYSNFTKDKKIMDKGKYIHFIEDQKIDYGQLDEFININ